MANNNDEKLARVFHFDLYGKRQEKYNFLLENDLHSIKWTELQPAAPDYFFVPKDFSLKEEYERGFKIDELFTVKTSGVKTHDDNNLVGFTPFLQNNQPYSYRPFDVRFINYDLKKVTRHRYEVMQHFVERENIGVCLMRSLIDTDKLSSVLITKNMMDINFYRFQSYIFPLYLYQETFGKTEKVLNMNEVIVKEMVAKIGVEKVNEIQIFDYIYAVLHSPTYREKYREFLKIDFPRIPYPENVEEFGRLTAIGERLRKLHLMEDVEPQNDIANFPIQGTNEIENPFTEKSNDYRDNKVWINGVQYFDNVPQTAWEFYIGGYQPAQKWLKDRKGRKLDYDDVRHYQKMIAVLCETERIMAEIDLAVPYSDYRTKTCTIN